MASTWFLHTNAAAPAVLMALYRGGEKWPVRQITTVSGHDVLMHWVASTPSR
jgi:hypothetical protein